MSEPCETDAFSRSWWARKQRQVRDDAGDGGTGWRAAPSSGKPVHDRPAKDISGRPGSCAIDVEVAECLHPCVLNLVGSCLPMKKRLRSSRFALCLVLTAASGCRPRSGAGDAGAFVPAARVDAGAPVTLLLHLEVKLSDGGVVRELLDPTVVVLLPVTQALDLTATLPLHNYRLRILDELDRALASDDIPEATSNGLRYHVALISPLRSGHRYTVLLDAQSGATLDDGNGVPVNEQRFEFHTEGERERELPAKRSPSRRHRRHADGN